VVPENEAGALRGERGGGESGLKRTRAEDGRNKRKRGLTTQEKEQEKEGS
jgi:hypothetical protein